LAIVLFVFSASDYIIGILAIVLFKWPRYQWCNQMP
jgi:hypothetical protein